MSGLSLAALKPGDALPEFERAPDNIDLFFYNAALWNAHRIHYDLPYAQDVEGYPGLVVPGPLLGDWLGQCVEAWLGDAGQIESLHYSNRLAAYAGDALRVGGELLELDAASGKVTLALFVKNAAGEVVTPGRAVARLARPTTS